MLDCLDRELGNKLSECQNALKSDAKINEIYRNTPVLGLVTLRRKLILEEGDQQMIDFLALIISDTNHTILSKAYAQGKKLSVINDDIGESGLIVRMDYDKCLIHYTNINTMHYVSMENNAFKVH